MPHRSDNKEFVEALARGLEIIRAFHAHKPIRTVSDLSSELDLARPTVHRILQTLTELGYVVQTDQGYYLTAKVIELGVSYIATRGFYGAARPHMEQLASDIDQAVTLCELSDADIVVIGRAEVPKIVAYNAALGQKLPAHSTALGRVLLAGLDDEELMQRLEMPALSPMIPLATVPKDELLSEIRQIRRQGWSMVDQTMSIGFHAIAAPITDANQDTVAAVGIIVHGTDIPSARLVDEIVPKLCDCARNISADFAHMASLPRVRATPQEPGYVNFTSHSTPA
ncbi:MAG: IclR family transcriptional regulator [Ilumatobacteraceae bacterium]